MKCKKMHLGNCFSPHENVMNFTENYFSKDAAISLNTYNTNNDYHSSLYVFDKDSLKDCRELKVKLKNARRKGSIKVFTNIAIGHCQTGGNESVTYPWYGYVK